PSRYSELVSPEDLGAILPDKPIKPAVYQLNEGQTLFFGGFGRFDFIQGERQSFTCFISGRVPIHRTKLEKADELFEVHGGELLSPPSRDNLQKLPEDRKSTRLNSSH